MSFLNYPHFSYFRFIAIIGSMGKEIGRSFKYNRSKISTPTLKKPVLSSSAAHTSSASNFTGTSISSQLDNKYIFTNQNKNNTSNIDDIHSCVTPRKKNYSVQATCTPPILTPLNATFYLTPVNFYTTTNLPLTRKKYLRFLINKKNIRLQTFLYYSRIYVLPETMTRQQFY